MINFKILSLATVATFALGFAPVQANDLMNNQASGFVEGSIISDVEDTGFNYSSESSKEVLVGGISVSEIAFNNRAVGSVNGDVIQMSNSDSLDAKVHVGSIKARSAEFNEANGYVSGNITQLVGSWSDAVMAIGTIDAGAYGNAYNNSAQGFVAGEIYQNAMVDSTSSLINVGSITSSETLR